MTLLSARLQDELTAVCPVDDREPLPKRARPLAEFGGSARDREHMKGVMFELRGNGVELEAEQIAARLLARAEDVGRALAVLRLAGRVVKLRGAGGKPARWKNVSVSTESWT